MQDTIIHIRFIASPTHSARSLTMKRIKIDLIQTPSPCAVGWDSMTGNDRERFCKQCNHTVHNLSAMTRKQAEALFTNANGSVCARYTRRADGSVVTADCIPNLPRVRGASLRLAAGAFGLLLAAGADGFAQTTQLPQKPKIEITTNQSGANTTQGKTEAKIVGNILDPYGAVVVGANITVQLNQSENKLTATSDETGSFIVSSLSPGIYTVIVNARGFKTHTAQDLKIDEGRRIEMSIVLEVDMTPREEVIIQFRGITNLPLTNGIQILTLIRRDNTDLQIPKRTLTLSRWQRIKGIIEYPFLKGKQILTSKR